MKFDVIVMLIFLATLPQTLKVIFSMEIALHHHRFCDFKYSNLEWACTKLYRELPVVVLFQLFEIIYSQYYFLKLLLYLIINIKKD